MIRLVPGLFATLVALGGAAAQDAAPALVQFEKLAKAEKAPRRQLAATWIRDHADSVPDSHAYLKSVARYWAHGEVDEQGSALLAVARAGSWKPDPAFEGAVLDLLYARFERAIAAKDGKLTRGIADAVLRFGRDPANVYRSIGGMLRQSDAKEFKKQFTLLMARLLADARVPSDARYPLSAEIMRTKPRPTRLSLFVKMPREKDDRGKPIPNQDIDGKEISIEQYQGKVLLVDFWATWCSPCLREMPTVVKAYEKYKDKGFDVLGISLDGAKSRERMPEVMKRFGMTWRQICDGKGWDSRFAKANDVNAIPFTFLLDRAGEIRYAGLRGEKLLEAIEKMLAE